MKRLFFYLATFNFFISPLLAQELTIGAQVRPRAEFRNGFKTLTAEDRDPAFFIEQRTRIFTDYKAERFRLHINLQDVRIWGAVDQIYKSDPALFNIYEGWGEFFFNDRLSFRAGRMALDYNNARFLGNLDWAAQGRSHDALMLRWHDETWTLHVAGAFNQTSTPPEQARLFGTLYTGVGNYKAMQMIWFQKKYERTDFSLLFHNDGRQFVNTADTTVAYRQTYGLVLNHAESDWSAGAELFYQGGKNGANTDISAFMLAANFTWKTDITPVTVGIDFLSGTALSDDQDNSFDPLYGTNHKFYGYMDYFYVGNFHGQAATTSGLNDIYAKANWKLGANANLNTHVHFFSSPAELVDPEDSQNEIDRYLGTEVDLVLVWKPVPAVVFNLGYSQMFATTSMEAIKSTPGDQGVLNNWAWLMVGFSPTLLKMDFSKDD